jgi:hypothetical protein
MDQQRIGIKKGHPNHKNGQYQNVGVGHDFEPFLFSPFL